ncbi:hypothetical protein [Ochrobactrum sp. S1502_03]|uniref:hypothetical protein n=1 Tax=Ochrobactrum sp. S1502_03 TaxID=3108451 RepID=UPI0037C62C55
MTRADTIDTRRLISVADLNTEIDKEPRVVDVRLGEALGFARPRKIREIIERNLEEIEVYGSSAPRRGAYRGQSFTEYFLNEGQALLICMFAKTVAAAAVRKALIDVFMEYRLGRVEKPVKVQAHNRRTSTKIDDALRLKQNVDRLERVAASLQQPEPKPQNVCAMIIDGEPVWVDVNKYDGDGRAVVIEHDGRMSIQNVEREQIRLRPFGARTALGERFRSPHGGVCRNSVAVVGMLIDQSRPMAALPDMGATIDHEPMAKTRAPYKEDILRLLPTGMSMSAIAQKVGCSTEAVKYWRRNTAVR